MCCRIVGLFVCICSAGACALRLAARMISIWLAIDVEPHGRDSSTLLRRMSSL